MTLEKVSVTSVSIVIPLWNEAANLPKLFEMLASTEAIRSGACVEVVLVNNGSTDGSRDLLADLAAIHSWAILVELEQNRNYGGGIYEGCRYVSSDYVCYIPGDLQYLAADIDAVIAAFRRVPDADKFRTVVKGARIVRKDSDALRLVSGVYTRIANTILDLKVRDVNGLPKLFSISLLDALPNVRMNNFVFDAQLLFVARISGYCIQEVDVQFHARRNGVSSWSGKRVRVYLDSFIKLFTVRAQRRKPGVAFERFDMRSRS